MAPELFGISEGTSGLSTRQSDVFALGMVTFEVGNVYHGGLLHGSESLSCTFPQVFTGRAPFSENKVSGIVTKMITDGERLPRPPGGKKLGLSDELWEVIQSSLAHKAEERPPVSTFVDFLEHVTPDIAILEGLTEFDANSEEHVQELRRMFEYADNTLLGMREEETLIVVEVFDRVNLLFRHPHPSNVPNFVWF